MHHRRGRSALDRGHPATRRRRRQQNVGLRADHAGPRRPQGLLVRLQERPHPRRERPALGAQDPRPSRRRETTVRRHRRAPRGAPTQRLAHEERRVRQPRTRDTVRGTHQVHHRGARVTRAQARIPRHIRPHAPVLRGRTADDDDRVHAETPRAPHAPRIRPLVQGHRVSPLARVRQVQRKVR